METRDVDRRIAALVLPDLLCELGLPAPAERGRRHRDEPPLGVVLVDSDATGSPDVTTKATMPLHAVNDAARRFGVRPAQTIAEARAFVARLLVREVSRKRVEEALGEVAEVALGFGPTVAFEAPDTVWVDVTGVAHLMGGEAALASELAARVRSIGHVVRVAIASGPRLSQAFARWLPPVAGVENAWVVPAPETRRRFAQLPVLALPITEERASWLVRLGVHTVGELAELPRDAVAARLGDHASLVLDLAMGHDSSPLVAYAPAPIPVEESSWDDALNGVEPLLFVLRGLVSRLSARLEGRGEAVQVLRVVLEHDRSIARLHGAAPLTAIDFELTSPLWRTDDLWRVVSSRLQKTKLEAPTRGMRLEATAVTRALPLQLHLAQKTGGARGPDAFPVLLAELAADIGKTRFGILELSNTHRPEHESRLVPVPAAEVLSTVGAVSPAGRDRSASRTKPTASKPAPPGAARCRQGAPARLLPRPIPLDTALRIGATLSIDHQLYTIEKVSFLHRLDSVEWWGKEAVSRDYLRVWLGGAGGGFEAWVYVNRLTGTRFLQAVCD